MQEVRAKESLKLDVGRVARLELFVDCPGTVAAAHAMWVDLELTRAGAAPANTGKNAAGKLQPKISDSHSGNAGDAVVADKLVVWNCNSSHWKDRGVLTCNVELRQAGAVVWSKKDVSLAWSKDAERATTVPLPNIPFDALRVVTASFHDMGPALCEIEILRAGKNLAAGKPATASGSHHSGRHPPGTLVDGIKDSVRDGVGYWVGPDHSLAWVEVQVAPPAAGAGSTYYLSDLPPTEAHIEPGRPLSQPHTAGAVTSGHSLFMHAVRSGTSHVAFALDKKYQTLSGAAAITDVAASGSATPLTFRIVGDGKELWRATLQKSRATKPVDLHVSRITKLELFVDCPGSPDWGHATWVDLRLIRTAQDRRARARMRRTICRPKSPTASRTRSRTVSLPTSSSCGTATTINSKIAVC